MQVIPINKQLFRVFPLDDVEKIIEITDEEYEGLMNRTKSFAEDLKSVIDFYETEEEKKQREKQEKQDRIFELQAYLNNTDKKYIQFSEGDITAEEYEEYKVARQSAREEIRRLREE